MASKSDFKIIANGHVLEVYEYEKGVYSGFDGKGGRRSKDDEKSDRSEEYRKQSNQKARNEVRRLVLSNFDEHSKFMTLTFKENKTGIKECNYIFKKFIERLRYHVRKHSKIDKFKYVAVIEFQERGAVHYHMICNAPYIKWDKLLKMWRGASGDEGGVDVRDIKNVDNIGAYMVKYMLKDMNDNRLAGEKAYLSSRGLERSIVFRGNIVQNILENYGIGEKTKKVFTNSYISEHHGEVVYKEYNLKRL